jgi:hypothetical protein
VRYVGQVMTRASLCFLVLLSSVMTSCVETLDIPNPPELDAVLDGYEHPTASVTSAVMSAVGDHIQELSRQIEDSDVFEEILDVIISVQEGLEEATDENGDLVIQGVAFSNPNGLIEINHDCAGWDPSITDNDPEISGSLKLTMVLADGRISPVVWGEATQCRFLANRDGESLQASFDGEVVVNFGQDPVPTSEPLRDLVATFVITGTLRAGDFELPLDQSFRVQVRGSLELLIELDDDLTFVYFFGLDNLSQGIRDVNGTYACSLEERECILPSGSFSW